MLEFPPVFLQKIFCFVQIPKSFVQKHETTAEETEGNTKENFPRHRVIVRSGTENDEILCGKGKIQVQYRRKKREKIPDILCRTDRRRNKFFKFTTPLCKKCIDNKVETSQDAVTDSKQSRQIHSEKATKSVYSKNSTTTINKQLS